MTRGFVTMTVVQIYLITIILIWKGLWAMSLSAEEGAELVIKCEHSNARGNVKYFCKDPCAYRDVLTTSKLKDPKNKYSIRDTGNTFYVTVSGLTLGDSGSYWCGVERVGIDTYDYVLITVTPRTIEDSSSSASLQNNVSFRRLLYVGAGLGALLLVLLTAAAVFLKHRHRDISKPMDDDVTYTDPFRLSQKPPPRMNRTPCSSANPSPPPSTPERSRGHGHKAESDIYANVEAGAVVYAAVLFSKSSVDASQSEGRTTPECTVYSEVKTQT